MQKKDRPYKKRERLERGRKCLRWKGSKWRKAGRLRRSECGR